MMRRTIQTNLLAALCSLTSLSLQAAPAAELWSFWQPQESTQDLAFDHTPWQQILDRYLVVGEQQIALFAYNSVTDADRQSLERYLQSLMALDPRQYPRDEQMAYWINLYNALTIRVVLQNPDKNSILRMGRGLFSFGPWNDVVATIAGQTLTLNDIEHRILRPIWQDHRIHFAVNCASLGCPDLSVSAYTSENLEHLLVQAELNYLNHPRGVRFQADGKLVVSSLFDWYLEDFAPDERRLLAYLAAHQAATGDRLRGYYDRIRYEYDWSLNAAHDP